METDCSRKLTTGVTTCGSLRRLITIELFAGSSGVPGRAKRLIGRGAKRGALPSIPLGRLEPSLPRPRHLSVVND